MIFSRYKLHEVTSDKMPIYLNESATRQRAPRLSSLIWYGLIGLFAKRFVSYSGV